MDSTIITTVASSLIISLIGSFFTILKTASNSKIKIENLNKEVDNVKIEMLKFKNELDQKVLLNQTDFVTRKEFEMFLKVIENIDKNVSRLNDKIDKLNSK